MLSTRLPIGGVALAIAVGVAAVMLATEPRLAIVWDEGYTLGREARLRLWFRALADPPAFAARWHPPRLELVQQVGAPPPRRDQIDTRSKLLFDPQVLAWFWPFAREEPHGHPPFYALVGLLGDVLTPWRADLPRARLGPIAVFSLTAGTLFLFMARRFGVWAGVAASGAWVLQPNLFGHGHYATYDAILSALWLNATLAFALATEERLRWRWVIVFGLLLGAAADTKLTGWFLPLPLLAWTALYRSRRGLVTLVAGGAIAGATLYLLNPPWWTEPVTGLVRFFASNLRRGETIPIPTLFLGRIISTPDGSLPWYNTLLWTAIVTPVGFLALALLGVGRAVRRARSEPIGLLAVGHWAFLLALRALPHTPGHDGVRQFLPAFGMLAMTAGLGAGSIVERFGRWGRAFVVVALAEGAISVALSMPVPLSYFSPIVGGLPGAVRLGMEPTYYWDALDDDALDWLNARTRPGEKVLFASFPTSWLYLQRGDRLRAGILPEEPGVWKWYVLQNRPGAFRPIDRALAAEGRPAFVVWKWGVPLLWIYPYEQVESLLRKTRSGAAPRSRARKTEPPTAPRVRREAVGQIMSFVWRHERPGSLTRGHDLRAGGGSVDDRGLARNRGRFASGALVAEVELHSVMAAATEVLEQTALRGRGRAGLADRCRSRARLHHGAGGRALGPLVATRRGVSRGEDAKDTSQGQSQKMSSHEVVSCSACSQTQKYAVWVNSRVWAFYVPCSNTKGKLKSGVCKIFFAKRGKADSVRSGSSGRSVRSI